MSELDIPYCLRMPYVGMSVGLVLDDVEQVHLTLRSAQKEKMSDLREEPYHLKPFFVATHPAENLFLGQKTVLSPAPVVDRRLHIT